MRNISGRGGIGRILRMGCAALMLGAALGLAACGKSGPAVPVATAPAMPVDHDGLMILEARWGTGTDQLDVRKVLEDQIKDGRVEMQADPKVLGDPAPYKRKQLMVKYDYKGDQRTAWFGEGSPVAFGALGTGGVLRILDARWGASRVDVRPVLEKLVKDGRLNMIADPAILGEGGAASNKLRITYEVNGRTVMGAFPQGGRVMIGVPPAGFHVLQAEWGLGGSVDVTDKLEGMIKDGELTFQATPEVLGGQSLPNAGNPLRLRYSLNGEEHTEIFAPGTVVTIGKAGVGPSEVAPTNGPVTIVAAQWGVDGQETDVTATVRALVKDGRLEMQATGLGSPVMPKNSTPLELTITYEVAGSRQTAVFKEGAKVLLGGLKPAWAQRMAEVRKSRPSGLVVLEATWGANTTQRDTQTRRDVTDICQAAVSGDSLTVPVGAEAFGERRDKTPRDSDLKITYTLDGRKIKSDSIQDGTTLQVGKEVTSFVRMGKGLQNVGDTVAELRQTYPAGLLVLDARWGSDSWTDLTDTLQGLVDGDSLTVTVSGEAFNEAPRWQPRLILTYYDGTELKTRTTQPGITIQIGPKVTSFLRLAKGMQSVAQTVAELRKKYPTGLLVLDARWGNTDVTELCQSLVDGDSLTVSVSSEAFREAGAGGPNVQITYWDGQNVRTRSEGAGSTLQIGPKVTSFVRTGRGMEKIASVVAELRKKYSTGLLVLDARWGSNTDVTEFCQSLVDGDSLTVMVSSEAFREAGAGGPNFQITYWDGQSVRTRSEGAASTLQIGPTVTSYVQLGKGMQNLPRTVAKLRTMAGAGLVILNAGYGAGGQMADMRDFLQSKVVGGKLAVKVGGAGWGDPAFGQVKHVQVLYWDGEEVKSIEVNDGGDLGLAAVGSRLQGMQVLPHVVPRGEALSFSFGVPGAYTLRSGPKGAVLSADGRLTWTPAAEQTGAQEFQIAVRAGDKEYVETQRCEVLAKEVVAAVGGDLSKVDKPTRLDLAGRDHQYVVAPNRSGALLLEKDKLSVVGPDGLTVVRTLALAKSYVKIAERNEYYVGIRLAPMMMDLIDKATGKAIKTIKLEYPRLNDLVLLPNEATSYVSVGDATTVPQDRIVVVNEAIGEVRVPKDLVGSFLQIDREGKHLWVGVTDLIKKGTEFHFNPEWKVMGVPQYGQLDVVLRFDMVEGRPVERESLSAVGQRGQGMRVSPDGKRVTYMSFSGFPGFTRNIASWDAMDFERKPVIYEMKDKQRASLAVPRIDYHPFLPLVVIPKERGLMIFGRESGDEEPGRLRLAPEAFDGAVAGEAWFSPDGLSVVVECVDAGRAFLLKVPLVLSAEERAAVKRGEAAVLAAPRAPVTGG